MPGLILFLKKNLSNEEEIIRRIKEKKLFITKDAIDELLFFYHNYSQIEKNLDLIFSLIDQTQGLVTKDAIKKICEKVISKYYVSEDKQVTKSASRKINLENIDATTGYLGFLHDRFEKMKKVIERVNSVRANLESSMVDKVLDKSNVRITGLLTNKREGKFESFILEFQDNYSNFIVIVPGKNRRLVEITENLEIGDVVIIEGELVKKKDGSYYIKANHFYETDLEWNRNKRNGNGYIVFISDIRMGNEKFSEESFLNFIDFLNGKIPEYEEISKNIRALIITGDLVEGIDLNLLNSTNNNSDIKFQYENLANLLTKINKNITIYVLPGERDAQLPLIPFLGFDRELVDPLLKLENIRIVDDPSFLKIENLNILATHGFYFENLYRNLLIKYDKKDALIKAIFKVIKKRELIPNLNIKGLLPIGFDPFIIEEPIDVFACGHYNITIHNYYKNCFVLSNSNWIKIHEESCSVYIINASNFDFKRLIF